MNISELTPLMVYDGEMFLGLKEDTKEIYYLAADISSGYIWQVLDCSECESYLAAYLTEQATLYQVYHNPKTKRRYEFAGADGNLTVYTATAIAPALPFEESILYPSPSGVFERVFPEMPRESIPYLCNCQEVLDLAVKRRLLGDYQ